MKVKELLFLLENEDENATVIVSSTCSSPRITVAPNGTVEIR